MRKNYQDELDNCARCDSIFYKRKIGVFYRGEYLCTDCYNMLVERDEENDDILYEEEGHDQCDDEFDDVNDDEPDEPEEEEEKIMTPKEIVAELDKNIIGQDEAKKLLAVAIFKHCKRAEAGPEGTNLPKSNILMKGPTGSGKTYLLQNIARLLDVPFCIVDASNLTSAGYKGNNVDTIIPALVQAADGDYRKAETGIIYLDEFDKLSAQYDVRGDGKAGVGLAVQRQLLKMIEGCVVDVSKPFGRDTEPIETKNILFICGGAFVDMDEDSQEESKPIGFCIDETPKEEMVEKEKPAASDFIKFGLIPELVGRLPIVVNLDKLTVEDMKKILTDSGESFLHGYQELMLELGVELEFRDDAIEEIAQQAYDRGVGARGINALVEGVMQDIMFEIPSDPTIRKCIITRDTVRGTKPPRIVHFKNKKAAS